MVTVDVGALVAVIAYLLFGVLVGLPLVVLLADIATHGRPAPEPVERRPEVTVTAFTICEERRPDLVG